MRSQHVFTHRRCNQRCPFCVYRQELDDPRRISRKAVEAEIGRAVAAGVTSIVFTGGEPTMRGDLALLVSYARARGAREVVLETNGTLVDVAMARSLGAAGVSLARVHLPRADASLDDVTRDPGGFDATSRGLLAFRDAGIPLEVSVPVVRSTLPTLDRIPAALTLALGESIPQRVVVRVPVESPDANELVDYGEATAAIVSLGRASARAGITLQLADGERPPPCMFSPRERPHHLYALSPGGAHEPGMRQLPGCRDCTVADRCPGVADAYLARHPGLTVTPIVSARARRHLSMVESLSAQIERELVQPSFPAGRVPEALVRVNFHCNQSCDFCFVSTHLPAAASDAVERAIERAAASGKRVVLTGGEPTLSARLVEYVAFTRKKAEGRWPVEIQTNAVLLDDETRVTELVAAGLDAAFVSLHASTADVSDRVTRAPGTFGRTLAGVDNLVRHGVRVTLNFVICTVNASELPRVVELAAARWPGTPLNVSFVAPSTDLVPRETWLIPRYSDVLPALEAGRARAAALGVPLGGFESMCGLPLCLVPTELRGYAADRTLEGGVDAGEFVRGRACAGCDLRGACWGVRRGYASLYGTDEMKAVVA